MCFLATTPTEKFPRFAGIFVNHFPSSHKKCQYPFLIYRYDIEPHARTIRGNINHGGCGPVSNMGTLMSKKFGRIPLYVKQFLTVITLIIML